MEGGCVTEGVCASGCVGLVADSVRSVTPRSSLYLEGRQRQGAVWGLFNGILWTAWIGQYFISCYGTVLPVCHGFVEP